jgi:hypothetical protein
MVTRAGSYTAAGTTQAQVDATSRPAEALDTAPPVTATVVAVRVNGREDLPDLAPLREALVDAGWSATTGDAPTPTLKLGVMAALHRLWTEITR